MSKSDYNFTSRLLHRMALQLTAVAEMSFDIETAFVKNKSTKFLDNHVFITGLARSGTTILMRYFYETGMFRSLTYLDMPFVLMPNTWKKIKSKKTSGIYKERAHQDNIMVGFDSPEALEEIFWRVFSGKEYIKNDRLIRYDIDEELIEKFKQYICNILTSSDAESVGRYLSKNNNNILRISQLQQAMPLAHFIIPFRDPLQHALSLLNQHLLFCKIQKEDKFSLDYMNWLGHFEFGLNQKPFFLNDDMAFKEIHDFSKTDINFWLSSWKNYYGYVIKTDLKNTSFFCYDDFCKHPTEVMSKLFTRLNVDVSNVKLEPFIPSVKKNEQADSSLLNECILIYNILIDRYNTELS